MEDKLNLNEKKTKRNIAPKTTRKAPNAQKKISLLDVITRTLDKMKFDYDTDEARSMVSLTLNGKHIELRIVISYNDKQEWIRCFAVSPVKVPEDKREIALHKINLINQENCGTCMRMDEEDGEISSCLLVNTDNGMVGDQQVMAAMHNCLSLIDLSFPDFMKTIYGDDFANVLTQQWSAEQLKN